MAVKGTKEKLLAIAAERFLAVGPDGVSLRDVARRAGITPMAIYRHYADKEALLLAVVEHGFDNYAAYLRRRPDAAAPDPVEHLRWLAGRVFDFAIDQGAFFELMFLTARTIRGLGDRSIIRRIHLPTYRVARDALRDAGHGTVPGSGSLREATIEMLAYCIGFCAFTISGALQASPDEARRQYLQGFDRLLARLISHHSSAQV
ncbi:MAG: TetR family transcriptional regulator [Rhizobiales bacterium]|nr:TetR family transcriptional regulator [Hyphomicrobiales bacterium]